MLKKNKHKKIFFVPIVICVGLILGLFLVGLNSDFRSGAKTLVGCKVCKKEKCVKNDKKCDSGANECSSNSDCTSAKKTVQKQVSYKYTCNSATGQCTPNLYGKYDSQTDCLEECNKSKTKSPSIVKSNCPTAATIGTRSCVKVPTAGSTYCAGLIRPYCCPVGKVFSHDGFHDSVKMDTHKVCCDKDRFYNDSYCCSVDLINGQCPVAIPVVKSCDRWCDINKPQDTPCCDGYTCKNYSCVKN